MGSTGSVITAVLFAAFLYGCASVPPPPSDPQMSVTYYSDPPNASLFAASGVRGPTPLTLHYDVPEDFTACVELEGLEAVWASGASQAVQLSACPGDALERQFTVMRPALPGRDVDLWYATRVADLGLLPSAKDPSEDRASTAIASQR